MIDNHGGYRSGAEVLTGAEMCVDDCFGGANVGALEAQSVGNARTRSAIRGRSRKSP
jgi:hypothetical protein